MIGYLDFVERVLRVVLRDRPTHSALTIWMLAEEVGLPLTGLSDAEQKPIILCLGHVLDDLVPHGLLTDDHNGVMITYPPAARRYRTESLSRIWPGLRSGYLDPDDDAFLKALAALSEQRYDDHADVEEIDAHAVVEALGWEWGNGDRAWQIYDHLKQRGYVAGRAYGGPAIYARVTYSGLVRALDEVGNLLREAEEHLQVGRLRAAGCVAAVELERRLKAIAPAPTAIKRRDPGLEDYNKAAYDAGVIDQATWTQITALAVIRKRCVHVLDREPEYDEVQQLIEGVEGILRRYSQGAAKS